MSAPAPSRFLAGRDRPPLWKRIVTSEHFTGWAFVAPAFVLIAIFGLLPIGWSMLLSLQDNNLLGASHYIGLANYTALAHDKAFRASIGHTLVYTALFVPISILGALGLAIALNRRIRGIRLYRMAVFVPVVTSTVATGIIFLWLLDPTFGLVNYIFNLLGLPQQQFLQDPDEALYCIVGITVWGWLGFDVIIYMAALQGIPAELIEAAQIDGASRWSTFRSIVLPLLGPATLFLVVWSTINALQLFDEVWVTTQGGPLASTSVIVVYLYQQAFTNFAGGYAAAIAIVLLIAIMAITLIQLWIGRRRIYYAS